MASVPVLVSYRHFADSAVLRAKIPAVLTAVADRDDILSFDIFQRDIGHGHVEVSAFRVLRVLHIAVLEAVDPLRPAGQHGTVSETKLTLNIGLCFCIAFRILLLRFGSDCRELLLYGFFCRGFRLAAVRTGFLIRVFRSGTVIVPVFVSPLFRS